MERKFLSFILENNLGPFSDCQISPQKTTQILKTREAQGIYSRVINFLSSDFVFKPTRFLWDFFQFTEKPEEILQRQKFFQSLKKRNSAFLKKLSVPRKKWKPDYEVVVVTEDEATFLKLKNLGCVSQLIVSENDILELERYDLVQVIDCPRYHVLLERLPQTIFVNSLEEVYLERYLEELSSWTDNLLIIEKECENEKIREVASELLEILKLTEPSGGKIMTIEKAENILEDINKEISKKLKEMTISGDILLKMLSEGKIPEDLLNLIREEISKYSVSEQIFNVQIPLTLDYAELESQIKRESATEFTNLAAKIRNESEKLRKVPEKIALLEALLLMEDFSCGLLKKLGDDCKFPLLSENLHMRNVKNVFLDNPQPISFQLDSFSRCSILTGANSGGKTTLLEHIIQVIVLFQLGLPTKGEVHLPIFKKVYYFAKNKGSASKGAFETLLSQMSKIEPDNSTLILADEIEAVTEPGVAGKIISATAKYFIDRGCFLVIATHLGLEVQKSLPEKARIDGIEAKGLDKNFNLIVDHNPILGRLAHSTPELIVEKLASSTENEYFKFLNNYLSRKNPGI